MKLKYISPEAEAICFVPAQRLAFSFDTLMKPEGNNSGFDPADPITPSENDIGLDLGI